MLIVGFNAYHGDVAAAVLRDGQLIAALEEERFSRVKHAAGFPKHAITTALTLADATPEDVTIWAVARGRGVHLLRKAWFALTHRPGRSLLRQYRRSSSKFASIPDAIAREFDLPFDDVRARMRYVEHHPAHLASAYHASGFDEAACCAIDGFGDFVSMSTAHAAGRAIDVVDRVYFPHSLGLLYLAITQFLGFDKYGDEYKVMGLAPYGAPSYADAMRRLVRLEANGRFSLDLDYFRHWTGDTTMQWMSGEPVIPDVYSPRLAELLGAPRKRDERVVKRHEDLAASIQTVFEECAFHVLRGLHNRVPVERLCLAGGCAMNSVANGKIRRETPFRTVFVQPAAGDNGTALGAALAAWHASGRRAVSPRMEHSYWGTGYDANAIDDALNRAGGLEGRCRRESFGDEAALCRATAARLADGDIVGWFQGRMEWGARALGNRSILADPRRADMREVINQKIKFRERFRPFAPSILEHALDDFFIDAVADPFMLQVYAVRPEMRSVIPAVTHVDGSGRLQTVSDRSNPHFAALLRAFESITGVPVLLNTSFNENEPIVERPEQALECFLRTDMDVLVMGPHMLRKVS